MKKLRLPLLALIVASSFASVTVKASAVTLCSSSNWPCRYTNVDGCCRVWSAAPGYYCPEWCD